LKKITVITNDQLNLCLSAIAGTDAVIVGGQALAYWADYYGIDWFVSDSGVTKDLDVFGNRAHLMQMGLALQVTPQVQNPRFMSALIGTIEIPMGDDLFTNIDVIHTLVGVERDEVLRNAVKVRMGDFECNMMHPLHVLESRIKNIEKIPEKRDAQGINQAALAIKIVNQYIRQRVSSNEESIALKATERVVLLGKVAAGKMLAKQGVNLIEAIPFDTIQNENFQKIRKPQIEMELAHLADLSLSKK